MNLDKNTLRQFSLLAIICIILFSAALTPVIFQNDTYYTIRIGEHIINNGIDMQDPFSWHEDLPYTYPHWLYDVGIYLIFHLGEISPANNGFLFLYISTVMLACTLGVLIYITCSKVSKNNLISFFITLLVMYVMRDFIAARAQLVTFNLFVLTILFIECFLETKKKRYLIFLILISILIANVHVAVWPFFFVLFMPYIAAYFISMAIEDNWLSKFLIFSAKLKVKNLNKKVEKQKDEEKKKKINEKLLKAEENLKKVEEREAKIIVRAEERRKNPYKLMIKKNDAAKWLILVVIICAFTGLLTPLKDTPYTYLVKTMQGNTTKSISEHLPLTLYNDKATMVILGLTFLILIFTDTKIKLEDLFMVGGLIYLSFMSRRQVSLLTIIGVFIFVKWLNYLAVKFDKDGSEKLIKRMLTIVGVTITICITVFLSIYFIKSKVNQKFINTKRYPVEACDWILNNLDVKNMKIYNEYNYGSYLLYRGIPVFIDSRADLYAPEFNKRDGEEKGRDIFSEYLSISGLSTYYETKFEEYGFTHLIMTKDAKLNMFVSRNDKYKEIYSDDNFVVYEVKK